VLTYIVRRALLAFPLLIGITLISFFAIRATGDPLAVYNRNPLLTPAQRQAIMHHYGLDQPMIVQYGVWLANIVRGDWGTSFVTAQPVTTVIAQRLPNTLILMCSSFLLTLVLAVPLGVYAALHRYTFFDNVVTFLTFLAYALPTFWLGLVCIMVFSVWLKLHGLPYFPAGGMYEPTQPQTLGALLWHLVLPMTVLAITAVARYTRYLRASMIEVLAQDYVRTARAKGIPRQRVLRRHVFKNAAIPVATLVMLDVPLLFGGALVTERVFAWPGVGMLFVDSADRTDYPVLLGLILIVATLVILFNVLSDIVYAWLDPRIVY
jgi:peptide/nickel transport system permease protein